MENINDDISFKLDLLGENDVFIAISYPKYTKLTFNIIKHLKKQNVKIISITDAKVSPIAKYSDIVLEAKNSSKTFTVVSTIVVINALVLYYANLDKEKSLFITVATMKHLMVWDYIWKILRTISLYIL